MKHSSVDAVSQVTRKGGSYHSETREAPNVEFFINMFIGNLPGTVIDTSSTTRVRDHVIYTPNQFCYRRSGAFIAFFQAIDYILGSNSWLPPFQLYLLENYFIEDRSLSKSDLIQAYAHLKKEGMNVEVDRDWFNVDVIPGGLPSLCTLPEASPVINWNLPPCLMRSPDLLPCLKFLKILCHPLVCL
ncbi:hypothetical protein GEMRC1_005424 [Eukaryota sp. GEM-RC1]